MPGQPPDGTATCSRCGSALRANAPFCGSCGQPVTNRARPQASPVRPPQSAPVPPAPVPPAPAPAAAQLVAAGRGVRCASFLLDLAVMLSPTLPLAIAAAILGVAEVVYFVVPVAFVAVWAWMQIWQAYTGTTFGKSMLGLRLVRAGAEGAPGLAATLTRSAVFGATAGVAALPVVTNSVPTEGTHDRMAGLRVIDITLGRNPLGPQQSSVLRRSAGRGPGLIKVQSPVYAPGRP